MEPGVESNETIAECCRWSMFHVKRWADFHGPIFVFYFQASEDGIHVETSGQDGQPSLVGGAVAPRPEAERGETLCWVEK